MHSFGEQDLHDLHALTVSQGAGKSVAILWSWVSGLAGLAWQCGDEVEDVSEEAHSYESDMRAYLENLPPSTSAAAFLDRVFTRDGLSTRAVSVAPIDLDPVESLYGAMSLSVEWLRSSASDARELRIRANEQLSRAAESPGQIGERFLQDLRGYSRRASSLERRFGDAQETWEETLVRLWDTAVAGSAMRPFGSQRHTHFLLPTSLGYPARPAPDFWQAWLANADALAREVDSLQRDIQKLHFEARIVELKLLASLKIVPRRRSDYLLPEDYKAPVRPLASTITSNAPPQVPPGEGWRKSRVITRAA